MKRNKLNKLERRAEDLFVPYRELLTVVDDFRLKELIGRQRNIIRKSISRLNYLVWFCAMSYIFVPMVSGIPLKSSLMAILFIFFLGAGFGNLYLRIVLKADNKKDKFSNEKTRII